MRIGVFCLGGPGKIGWGQFPAAAPGPVEVREVVSEPTSPITKGAATCCHGEEPHAVGWRFITERRAVNLDLNCGWARGKADVPHVADAFDVMRRVNALLGPK